MPKSRSTGRQRSGALGKGREMFTMMLPACVFFVFRVVFVCLCVCCFVFRVGFVGLCLCVGGETFTMMLPACELFVWVSGWRLYVCVCVCVYLWVKKRGGHSPPPPNQQKNESIKSNKTQYVRGGRR